MKKIIAFVIAIVGFFNSLQAQYDFTFYQMDFVPQVTTNNPAVFPMAKVNVGVSPMIYFGNSFKYSDFVTLRSDDSLEIDMSNLISKLKKRNYFSVHTKADILTLGFRIKQKNYFQLNVTERFDFLFTYPGDLVKLFWEGNGASLLGQTAKFDNFGIDLSHYREYGLLYSREINDKITAGIKLKKLYGMENIYTKTSTLSLTTDEQTFDINVQGQMEINSSGISELNDSSGTSISDHLFGLPNNGWGIDLGITYKFDEKTTFSGSIIDLGYISWSHNTSGVKSNNINYTFTGFDLYQIVATQKTAIATNPDSVGANVFEAFRDSLQEVFKLTSTNDNYKTRLYTRYNIGASYEWKANHTLNILAQGMFYKGRLRTGISLAYQFKVKRFLSLIGSYSAFNRSYLNIGGGFSFNLGPLQAFVVSDNFYAVFAPQHSKNVHLRAGINLTFGKKMNDADNDGIADKKDNCPELAGLKKWNGCPDSDHDNIPDDKDKCPLVYGLEKWDGCPDTDGDGISDLDDDCIDVAGTPELNGCPDTDGDGLSDYEDACPEKPGKPEDLGCPDSDGDGIVDSKDECPEKPGAANNFGCPITKLVAIGKNGQPIQTVELNAEGVFEFENLPPEEVALFKLEGDVDYLPDEMLIVFDNNGKKRTLSAFKNSDKKFEYRLLPEDETSMALMVLDDEGNLVRIGFRNKDGKFVFENLPLDQPYLFKIKGSDEDLPEDLKIIIKNFDGAYEVELHRPVGKKGFDYDYLPNDSRYSLALIEYSDEGELVFLEPEEKQIIEEAYAHLEFNFNSAVISPKSYKALDKLVDLLKKHPDWKIKLSGYTDDIGDEITNLALSKRRAEAVKKYLMQKGIANDRIIVKYYGEANPVASNDTEENRRKNRRVEMVILK